MSVRLSAALIALVAPGCSLFVSAGPDVRIDSIDGDGTAAAVVGAPDVADVRPGARRLRDRLVVTGDGLLSVTDAQLAGADAASFSLVPVDGGSDVSRSFLLPDNIRAGLMTLTLVGGTTASAQVFLLQGEKGDSAAGGGVALADITTRSAAPEDCPFSGTVFEMQFTDGTTRNDKVCRLSIEEPRTFAVSNEDELLERLTALSRVRFSAPVTLQLQSMTLNNALILDHIDGHLLTLTGASNPTTLTAANGIRVLTEATLTDVELVGAGDRSGVVVSENARMLLSNIKLRGYDFGVVATFGAYAGLARVTTTQTDVGLAGDFGAHIVVDNCTFDVENGSGVSLGRGAAAYIESSTMRGGQIGLQTFDEASAVARDVTITNTTEKAARAIHASLDITFATDGDGEQTLASEQGSRLSLGANQNGALTNGFRILASEMSMVAGTVEPDTQSAATNLSIISLVNDDCNDDGPSICF
jgi:hypothetical protein